MAEILNVMGINTHNGIKEKGIPSVKIDDYPAIKQHLDSYYVELAKRTDQGDTLYNLRNCAYMELKNAIRKNKCSPVNIKHLLFTKTAFWS